MDVSDNRMRSRKIICTGDSGQGHFVMFYVKSFTKQLPNDSICASRNDGSAISAAECSEKIEERTERLANSVLFYYVHDEPIIQYHSVVYLTS